MILILGGYNIVKELLKEFQSRIIAETKKMIVWANDQNSDYSSEIFDVPMQFSFPPALNKLRGRMGLYIFITTEAKTLSYDDVKNWHLKIKGAGFKQWKKTEINDGDCLYVGSCTNKSLYSRIKEHFSKDGSYTALKLSHPTRNMLLDCVKCYAFPIKKEFSKQEIRIVVTSVEKELHNCLMPHCGSSRV